MFRNQRRNGENVLKSKEKWGKCFEIKGEMGEMF